MPAANALVFSETVWRDTRALFEPYAAAGLEAGLFWYGMRFDSVAAVALTVGIPNQVNHPRNFEIPADSLAELVRLVPEPMVVVAQLHTHPGHGTNHSPWDDERAVSRKILSLVLPDYGHDPSPEGIGAHEFGDGWYRLGREQTSARLWRVPAVIDTRR